MSETDAMAELQSKIEAATNSEESHDESEVESDAVTEESDDESITEEEEATTEEESDESSDQSDTESEVQFDFQNTSTSIQQLVSNLKNLSPEDRAERISKITRAKELEAVKKAFPDAAKEEAPVSREELNALNKKFEELSALANPELLQKALDQAAKLSATETLTDSRMKTLMLQEQFGESHKEVTNDPKFITAYEKFPSLSIAERLDYACSLSPVARKLAVEDEVQKQVRLSNTRTVSKGKQTASSKKAIEAKDVKNLDDFEKMMQAKFSG